MPGTVVRTICPNQFKQCKANAIHPKQKSKIWENLKYNLTAPIISICSPGNQIMALNRLSSSARCLESRGTVLPCFTHPSMPAYQYHRRDPLLHLPFFLSTLARHTGSTTLLFNTEFVHFAKSQSSFFPNPLVMLPAPAIHTPRDIILQNTLLDLLVTVDAFANSTCHHPFFWTIFSLCSSLSKSHLSVSLIVSYVVVTRDSSLAS